MNSDQVFALVLVTIFGVVVPFGLAWIIPAARARARRIEREGMPADAGLLAEVDQLRLRVEEMEERLEFAERVVATRDGSPNLIEGGRS